MLILGAPGAGKTTLLLELARDLIARARNDPQHPIPLVFNLSTWASKRQPLKEWLAEELNQRYDVPSKLAAAWVEADGILPLLDGLDEVAPDHRDACVEAINTYRQERGLVSLAVCSRSEEYAALAGKLRLRAQSLSSRSRSRLSMRTCAKSVERLAEWAQPRLAAADHDFATRRKLIDAFDWRFTLLWRGEQRVVIIHWFHWKLEVEVNYTPRHS